MKKTTLPYDPGIIPYKPSPKANESIIIKISGLPPYKDEHFSIRNQKHKIHNRFIILRKAAIKAMAGRAPYRNAIGLAIKMYASKFEKNKALLDYMGGIEDTLDGSSGQTFTYLPVVFEDDCQVCAGNIKFVYSKIEKYEIIITFL